MTGLRPNLRPLYNFLVLTILGTGFFFFFFLRSLHLPWSLQELLDKPLSHFEDARTMKIYGSMTKFVASYNRWTWAIHDGLPEEVPASLTQRERLQRVDNSMACAKELMDTCAVPYFLWAGTLLGVVRFNNHLPWDNDADFALLSEEAPSHLLECLEAHPSLNGYWLDRPTPNGTLYWANERCAVVEVRVWKGLRFVERETGFTTDAMVGSVNADQTYSMADGWGMGAVPRSVVLPLQTDSNQCQVNGRRYSCPNDPVTWLATRYGAEVSTAPQWLLISVYATSHYWTVTVLLLASFFLFIRGAGVTLEIGLSLVLLPLPLLLAATANVIFNAATAALSTALLVHALFFHQFARSRSKNPAFSPRASGILAGIALLVVLWDLFPIIHNTMFLAALIKTPLKTDFSEYQYQLTDTYKTILT